MGRLGPTEPNDDEVFHQLNFAGQPEDIASAPKKLKQQLQQSYPPARVNLVAIFHLRKDKHIYFYNDQALVLSQEYGIDVPTNLEQGRVSWGDMKHWPLEISVKWPK
jgi:hypothetical protein